MIEKLNFYDIYGYLLPGLVLVAAIWLPYAVILGVFPTIELTYALALLLLSYVAGHLIQSLAEALLSSKTVTDSGGRSRLPSDLIVEPSNNTFTPDFLADLELRVLHMFKVDIASQTQIGTLDNAEADSLAKRRNEAFFFCRNYLKREKLSYAEQFQGMYALTRGISVSCSFAAAYSVGWQLRIWCDSPVLCAAFVVIAFIGISVGIILTLRRTFSNLSGTRARHNDTLVLFSLLTFTMALGFVCAVQAPRSLSSAVKMGLVTAALLLVTVRFSNWYEHFAMEFARTVWRDFVSLTTMPSEPVKAVE